VAERKLESAKAADLARIPEDEIRPLAYKKWQHAGCPVSDGVEFWIAAEAEILRSRRR